MTARLRHFVFIVMAMLLAHAPAFASGDDHHGSLFPHVPEPEGKECVEPEDEMRRNHMNYILHQRDETMYRGIRTPKYSLAECIDCHVFPDENGRIATHDEKEHFCSACHQYASVQIDCFDCHADKPQKYIKRGKRTADATIRMQLNQALASTAGQHSTDSGSKQK